MIERLFPSVVVTETARIAELPEASYAEELECVRRAVPERRREFLGGRTLARRALRRLGIADAPLRKGPDRVPVWPEGIVGSISHAAGLCGVAVARRSDVAALGLDIESAGPLAPEIAALVCTPQELEWIACVSPPPGLDWPKLIFCAKECVYKVVYTLTARHPEFHEIRVRPGPADGELRASTERLHEVRVRFAAAGGVAFAGLWIPIGRQDP